MAHDVNFDWSVWMPKEEATLLFVLDKSAERVLLIHKKRGLGAGKINGPGGRLEPGETPLQAALRETREEVGVTAKNAVQCAKLSFHFTDGYDLLGHVFHAAEWEGEPVETDEALPEWFPFGAIPYGRMWADDAFWFPLLLAGKTFEGKFVFDNDTMLSHEITVQDGEPASSGISR